MDVTSPRLLPFWTFCDRLFNYNQWFKQASLCGVTFKARGDDEVLRIVGLVGSQGDAPGAVSCLFGEDQHPTQFDGHCIG